MATSVPSTLSSIRQKVRRVTGRPSPNQISDAEIDNYVNTFYMFDMPEHLRMESLRVNYQFTTTANIPVYDMPTGIYLEAMPPVFIGGYQSYMTQSRENFFRINPQLNFLQQSLDTGNGTVGPYSGTCTQTPITPGFQPNPPGAYSFNTVLPPFSQACTKAAYINWNVIISALGNPDPISGIQPSISLIDDGHGNLIDPLDPADPATGPNQSGPYPVVRGTINYLTGAVQIGPLGSIPSGFSSNIPSGTPINIQYIPYVASRPQSVAFYQDQFMLYPIPDQAYTVSFEAYQYPSAFLNDPAGMGNAQVKEWWQMLAYGAADKIFADNGDLENLQKYRPLLEEQMNLCLRRTIVQQTSERTASIYTEQSQFPQYPFGNLFSGF